MYNFKKKKLLNRLLINIIYKRGIDMDTCNICKGNFDLSPDEIVLCEHKDGFVHLGCCVSLCSMDGKPCTHSKAIYAKISK